MNSNATQELAFSKILLQRNWNLIEVVRAHGLMAQSRACLGRVIHAISGKKGFAKCIWEAGATAGPDTQMLASQGRLARVMTRLEAIRQLPQIPMVSLLDVAHVAVPGCLLIVMEQVIPLAEQINGLPNDKLAISLLRAFDPDRTGEAYWTHFDICPANSGTNEAGSPVLIDPESAYLLTEDHTLDVSCPVAKWHRSPKEFLEATVAAMGEGRPGADFALSKHRFEVLLLAAEISLGQSAPCPRSRGGAEDWLLPWFAQLTVQVPLRERAIFWRLQLVKALDQGNPVDLSGVAETFQLHVANNNDVECVTPISIVVAELEPQDPLERFARDMRADRLIEGDLRKYLTLLLDNGRVLDSVQPWIEACLVCVCYLRDRSLAPGIVAEATRKHPEIGLLQKWQQMIELWAGKETIS